MLDLNQPFYGEKEYTLDLSFRSKPRFRWAINRDVMISMNIRNVLDRDDPIPVEMDIHGQPVVMARVDGIQVILGISMELW